MASLQDVKSQIAGIGKTKQITKAMNLVSSSKLRGAQARIERFRPYATKFSEMLGDLAARTDGSGHPLLTVHQDLQHVVIVLVTSERGLCGAFNVNLINAALTKARQCVAEGKQVRFICVGRKGLDAVRKQNYEIIHRFIDVMGGFDFQLAIRLGSIVSKMYSEGEADEVFLVYSDFRSIARQIPTVTSLLPVVPNPEKIVREDAQGQEVEYVYEPEVGSLLSELLPRYVNVQLHQGLLSTSAGENAARMTAMDNATRNCNELIGSLTLLYNKTRQAAITNEILDIVGGANALQQNT